MPVRLYPPPHVIGSYLKRFTITVFFIFLQVTTSEEGTIEVHNISKQFAVAQLDEVYQFASYLEQAL